MISKFLKGLFSTGKKAKESVEKSMDFLDDVLEKEYITSTIDNIKESTGKVVESAGTMYQKTKDVVEDNINMKNIKGSFDKALEKGKEMTSELSDIMLEKSESLKNVMEEGKDIVKDIFDVEEE